MMRGQRRLWVPILAVLAMLGSGLWLATQGQNPGRGVGPWGGMGWPMMGGNPVGGYPMMGGNPRTGWLPGDSGPVDDLAEARNRAQKFAVTLAPGLRVGEVMRFSNNYYAELEESNGAKATEVLIEPRTGAVQLEFGPAMMWNTRYGMMARPIAPARVSAKEAQQIAQRWAAQRDMSVAEAEGFPGYYTLHTLRNGRIRGMVSVNAVTGAVWFHSWHGRFVEMSESK